MNQAFGRVLLHQSHDCRKCLPRGPWRQLWGPRALAPQGPAPSPQPLLPLGAGGGSLVTPSHHPSSGSASSSRTHSTSLTPPPTLCSRVGQDFPGFLPRFIIERSRRDFPNQLLPFSPNTGKWVFSYCLCDFSPCIYLITAA